MKTMNAELKNGMQFVRDQTRYEIVELKNPDQSMICTIEVQRLNSPLNKINNNYYQYFSRYEILAAMEMN